MDCSVESVAEYLYKFHYKFVIVINDGKANERTDGQKMYLLNFADKYVYFFAYIERAQFKIMLEACG